MLCKLITVEVQYYKDLIVLLVGSPQHLAKECPSRLSRGPEERTVHLKDSQPKVNGMKK